MVTLDFSLLNSTHFFYFGLAFFLIYLFLQQFLNHNRPPLRQARTISQAGSIYYAGPVLIAVITFLTFYVLDRSVPALGLVIAAILIIIFGSLDERHALSPAFQLLAQTLIAVSLIASGWIITRLTNPFGEGVIQIAELMPSLNPLPVALLTLVWFLVLINAINWLDGMDGLASGVIFIAFIASALVALLPSVQDSQTLVLSAIGAGSVLGILIWNFPPAKVYLGTSGSWFLACFLGIVALSGGGKIVTTLLILSLPIIDAIFVIIERLLSGQPPWLGDRQRHLHFRLQTLGFSPRLILWLALSVTALTGYFALVLQTTHKIIAFAVAAFIIGVTSLYLIRRTRKKISRLSV